MVRTAREYITIVIDRDSLRILVEKRTLDDDDQFGFLHLTSAEVCHFGDKMCKSFTPQLNELTKTSFQLTFLYCTKSEARHRHLPMKWVVMLECARPVKPVDDHFVWLDVRNLRPETFPNIFDVQALPYARRVLEECSENGVRPWEKPGWFQTTTELATAALASIGYRVISPFQQFSVSPGSAILKVPTDKGNLYLKASNKREGRITDGISSIDPKLVRKPLYVDSEREWMLMEDYGSTLESTMSRQDYENLKCLLAGLQRKSSKNVQRLVDSGVSRVDTGDILRRTEKMLRDIFLSEGGGKASIEGVCESLDENAIRSHCRSVSALLKYMYENEKIPLTLCHGDLYDCNVIKCDPGKDSFVIVDWEAARIDVPLATMHCLATNIRPREDRPEIDDYLEHWADYGSFEKLKRLKRCSGLKFWLVEMIVEYEYALDKGLRPYLQEDDMICLSDTLNKITEQVEELNLLTG